MKTREKKEKKEMKLDFCKKKKFEIKKVKTKTTRKKVGEKNAQNNYLQVKQIYSLAFSIRPVFVWRMAVSCVLSSFYFVLVFVFQFCLCGSRADTFESTSNRK